MCIQKNLIRAIYSESDRGIVLFDPLTGAKCIIRDFEDQQKIRKQQFVESYGAYPIETIRIAITGECNLYCHHCFVESPSPKKIEYSVIQKTLKQLKTLGLLKVGITGGEPFLYPEIWQLFEYCLSLGLSIHLNTNGTLFSNSTASRLAAVPVASVHISIDGSDNSTHDFFRQQEGAFDKAKNSIQSLVCAGVVVRVTTCLHKRCLSQLPKIYDILSSLGVSEWLLAEIVSRGRAKKSISEQLPSLGEIYEALHRLRVSVGDCYGKKMRVTGYLPELFFSNDNENIMTPCCQFPGVRKHLYLSCSGDVIFDTRRWRKLGNIYKDSIEDIWLKQGETEIRTLDKLCAKLCSECSITNSCLSYISEG